MAVTASLPSPSAFIQNAINTLMDPTPRPGLHSAPGTKPLTLEAVLLPPLVYYIALLFLPPSPPQAMDTLAIKALRTSLALLAGTLFFRLPMVYYIPFSVGLNYQLALVGIYGGCRVLDAFFISPILFGHVPRRVRYEHKERIETSGVPDTKAPFAFENQRDWEEKTQAHRFTTDGRTNGDDRSAQPAANSSRSRKSSNPSSTTTSNSIALSDLPENVPYTRGPSATGNPQQRRNSLFTTAQDSYFALQRSATNTYNSTTAHTITNTMSSLSGPTLQPVYQLETSEDAYPHTFLDRASWALELELSMRGMGFTWSTADVRHTRKTWLPTIPNRLHSITVHVLPVLTISLLTIRHIYTTHLLDSEAQYWSPPSTSPSTPNANAALSPFDTNLTLPLQLTLTAALGAFLMVSFSLSHSLFAILLSPLAPSPLAFFPPLYTTRIWDITTVRGFWSYGWHRLFARLFLVFGVWPGEWLERRVLGKKEGSRADVGKVLGGFASSAVCHSFAVRSVLGGSWGRARGEAVFFALNGGAVVVEEIIARYVRRWRRARGWREVSEWDKVVGRVWWLSVLLWSGRNFARGWVNAGLVREMAGL